MGISHVFVWLFGIATGTPIFVLLTLVMLRLESPSMIRTMFVAQLH